MRVLFAPLFARLLIPLRVIGPYAAIELLMPGGTLIALLYWWYRNRVTRPRSEISTRIPAHILLPIRLHRKSDRNAGPSQHQFRRKIAMYAKTALLRTRPLLSAVLACMLFSGALAARDHNVTITVPVSARGLDLTRVTDARTFYTRLKNAAWVACTHGNRVGLEPVANVKGCYEEALGGAVRSAKAPLVTQIYLSGHTIQDAVAHGIEIPAQVAGR